MKILFVVPTINCSIQLKRLVTSLKSQNHKNWRLLIVDGGSIEKDLNYIKGLASVNEEINYEIENNGPKSIYGAMNQGWRQSKQDEWVIFWGADDWAPKNNTIREIYKEIEMDRGKSDIIIFEGEYRDKKNRRVRLTRFGETRVYDRTSYRKKLICGKAPAHQASVFSPNIKKYLNEFSTEYKIAADLDYFIKISNKIDLKVKVADKVIVNIGTGGVSGKEINLKLKEVKQIYKKHFQKNYISLIIARYINKFFDQIRILRIFDP